MKRVLVTGYGLVTPLGSDVATVWGRVCNGESGIRTSNLPNLECCRTRIAGQCLNFTTDGCLPPHEAKRLDLFDQYANVAAINAVKQSGLDFKTENTERCAVIIGSGAGGMNEFETQYIRLEERGPSKVSPFAIPRMIPNSAAGHVSIRFGILGPSYCVSTACATSVNAIADAVRLIRHNEADIVIAGGSEASVTRLGLVGFAAMRALSERNDEPQRASRPFDKDRDGFVLSDGGGILVLESEEHAVKRKAEVLGEVRGFALTSDATHIAQPDVDGNGAYRAIRNVLADAGVNAADVDYINAHGTSTILGDLAEVRAIKRAFGTSAYSTAISSTKSVLGHQLGGSGAVEAIFCLLAMRDGIVPPTVNLENPGDECDLDFTPLTAKERPIKTALSNSFGFGGHNGCLVFGQY